MSIAAFGVEDQHSQIQLYNEGPNDKVITFIEAQSFRKTVLVPAKPAIAGLEYLSGLRFNDIMHAEKQGTAHALTQSGRPNGTLTIPSISPESIGALLQFFMIATAYMAEFMQINAFNQPGVEAGKIETKRILTRRLK